LEELAVDFKSSGHHLSPSAHGTEYCDY